MEVYQWSYAVLFIYVNFEDAVISFSDPEAYPDPEVDPDP